MKVHLDICVDVEIAEKARALGLNISEICNNSLAQATNTTIIRPMDQLLEVWREQDREKCIEALKRNLGFAKGQVRLIENQTGINIRPKELVAWFRRITK